MAQYTYDEGGNMAAYFALSFLILLLIPMSFSFLPSRKSFSRSKVPMCQCPDCDKQRARVKKETRRTLCSPKFTTRAVLVILGWAAVAFLTNIVIHATNDTKIYDPFEILGLKVGTAEKEIKRHFKRLSIKFHPDKYKPQGNETAESISAKFVELTKAYKSLTDETIRDNLAKWGHPDGRQETTMGIAIPKSFIEGKNSIWVLAVYALLFGGSLPFIVGRWWFGSRSYTKDSVHAKSAETFFKDVREDSSMEEVIIALATAWPFEKFSSKKLQGTEELEKLEKLIAPQVNQNWMPNTTTPLVRRALVLLYAHMLRLPVESSFLRNEQKQILIHSPTLLNSVLNMTLARNWLTSSLHAIRLGALLTQAVYPSNMTTNSLLQFPGITTEDVQALSSEAMAWGMNGQQSKLSQLAQHLSAQNDPRVEALERAGKGWGQLEIVDVYYKVIGEKIITPGAFVNLVMKLRISPPMGHSVSNTTAPEHDKRDNEFLSSRKDAEDLRPGSLGSGFAHAPYWPTSKKPQWWAILGDDKTGKVVVTPVKIAEVPLSDPTLERNFRTWKIVFQAPNQVGLFTWKIRFVSDTFVGEEPSKDLALKLDDPSLLDSADLKDDEISDPEEDSLAGQMAAMRGQKVKKAAAPGDEEEEDDTSGTDDDEEDEESSSSDSD